MKVCIRAHDMEVKGTENTIKSLQDAGADGAQLVCYKSYDDIKKQPNAISSEHAESIGDGFEKADLSIDLIGAYFNPVHSDKDKVREGYDIFCDYLQVSRQLGCSVVGSETGSYSDEPWVYHPKNRTEAALDEMVSVFSGLCDVAAEYGASVGIEGAGGHVCYSVKTLKRAIEKIDKENIKVIFDLYNFLDKENYREYLSILDEGLKAFAGRIHCFHIKDCVFGIDGYSQCDVGMGDMDFDSILSKIKKYDNNAVLILEGTKKANIKNSIEFLRNMWGKT